MTLRHIIRRATLALAIAATTASTAAAMPARDSRSYPRHAATPRVLPNPDENANALPAGHRRVASPAVSVLKGSQPAPAHGFDSGDAGLGAVMTVTVLLGLGGAAYLVQRRRGLGRRQQRRVG